MKSRFADSASENTAFPSCRRLPLVLASSAVEPWCNSGCGAAVDPEGGGGCVAEDGPATDCADPAGVFFGCLTGVCAARLHALYIATSRPWLTEQSTVDPINTVAEWFFAGFT